MIATPNMKKYTDQESDAYMGGWGFRHRGLEKKNPFRSHLVKVSPATQSHPEITEHLAELWDKGFDDCERGAIDAPLALGSELVTE